VKGVTPNGVAVAGGNDETPTGVHEAELQLPVAVSTPE